MSTQLHTGDAVLVLPTGEVGLLVGIYRTYPAAALVSLGEEGLWTFPLNSIDRADLHLAAIDDPSPPSSI